MIEEMEELIRELANIELWDEVNLNYIQERAEAIVVQLNAR